MTRATKIAVYVVLGVIGIALLVLLLNVAVGYEGGAREVGFGSPTVTLLAQPPGKGDPDVRTRRRAANSP
jgi:hypothetical protein